MMMVARSRLMIGVRAIVLIIRASMIIMMVVGIISDVAERQVRVVRRTARLVLDTIDDAGCRRAGERKRERDAEHCAHPLQRESGRPIHDEQSYRQPSSEARKGSEPARRRLGAP
jgi:hypothetical protein